MTLKKSYTNQLLVSNYDYRHFGGPGGKYVFQKEIKIISSFIGNKSGLTLDIPCGTGIYTDYFQDAGISMIGGDASIVMLNKTSQRNSKIPLILCDVNHLPFMDDSLDGLIIIRLFQHLPLLQMNQTLAEACRVIKKGGRVVFDTFRWSPRKTGSESYDGIHVYSINEVKKMIKESRLSIRDYKSAYLFSAILYRKLPIFILKFFDSFEKYIPENLLLRTFWYCSK
jgi:ubiquinone/menaquinone biosynthesis C-methylase UbiE